MSNINAIRIAFAFSMLASLVASAGEPHFSVSVAQENVLAKYWIAVFLPEAPNPEFVRTKGRAACVNVGFVIEGNGTTSADRPLLASFSAGTTDSEKRNFYLMTRIALLAAV